jgi:hypothetical protein
LANTEVPRRRRLRGINVTDEHYVSRSYFWPPSEAAERSQRGRTWAVVTWGLLNFTAERTLL